MKPWITFPALLLAACVPDVPEPSGSADPFEFFAGRSTGQGALIVPIREDRPIRVESRGDIRPDGSLAIVQIIRLGDEAPRTRRWDLRRTGSTSFVGSLTDADGPVEAVIKSGRLHIEYRDRDGFAVTQWLTPLDEGQAMDNRMSFRRFGITLANVEERIDRR